MHRNISALAAAGFGVSLLTACPSDDTLSTTADSESSTGDDLTTSTATATAATVMTTTAGTLETDPQTDTGPTCGDDVVESDEVCDGVDLGGQDCVSQGFGEGALACAGDCSSYDTSQCITYSCGNDVREGDEICDGAELVGEDCLTQGFDEGELACADDCSGYDTAKCIKYMCGNDVVEGDEVCDNADLGGQDCLMLGFDEGTLGCDVDCSEFDTAKCIKYTCGNDVVEGDEVCDGLDVGMEDCTTQGFVGGTLGCAMDCLEFDTSMCASEFCSQDTPLAIPDYDFLGVIPTIEVPESLTIGDVDVRVKITHTALADLELRIQSPEDTLATMWDAVLDINNNHCSGDDMDIILDDESPNVFQCIVPGPVSMLGDFMTEADPLSKFDGEDPMGTWYVTVHDIAPSDTGTVDELCLIITPS